jgi:hypothetical protein
VLYPLSYGRVLRRSAHLLKFIRQLTRQMRLPVEQASVSLLQRHRNGIPAGTTKPAHVVPQSGLLHVRYIDRPLK